MATDRRRPTVAIELQAPISLIYAARIVDAFSQVPLTCLNDQRRPRGTRATWKLHEAPLWADMLRVHGNERFYAYVVDNQAIVVPETIDATRALTAGVRSGAESLSKTNAALGTDGSLI
jgi:hypothetical protein